MRRFITLHKTLLGLGAFGGTYYYLHVANDNRNVAFTSWTTNFTASVKWDENWDHRSPKSLLHPKLFKRLSNEKENVANERIESVSPTATRHIILVRHGQYNMDGSTDTDRYLTKLGRQQAEYTAQRLKALNFPYSLVVKSTMTRAQETGKIILSVLSNVPVKDCHLIREGAPIPPEPPIGHWKPEVHQFYQDGARIEAGFREYFHRADASQAKDSYTVLVCHANVIRYFVCRALQFPPEAWLRMSLNHASITWLSIAPSGRVVLRALGDSGHIPPSALSV